MAIKLLCILRHMFRVIGIHSYMHGQPLISIRYCMLPRSVHRLLVIRLIALVEWVDIAALFRRAEFSLLFSDTDNFRTLLCL